MTGMLRHFVCALAPSVVCLVGHTAADDAGNDQRKITGSWEVTELFKRGGPLPKKEFEGTVFVFGDGKLEIIRRRGPDKHRSICKLDETTKPKTIELSAPGEKRAMIGIYELDGDTLKVCLPNDNIDYRPKEFAAKEGCLVFVLKRMKP